MITLDALLSLPQVSGSASPYPDNVWQKEHCVFFAPNFTLSPMFFVNNNHHHPPLSSYHVPETVVSALQVLSKFNLPASTATTLLQATVISGPLKSFLTGLLSSVLAPLSLLSTKQPEQSFKI